ncbi:hypothetical protein V5F40_21635 [Xanthobacter sp. DSM 14520]|uniref:hypothetical protein n=1 Tax=Xanthobacter autotrophicus (strain ATCC BAA-1158 / Py2) TaxID=78245 RepID=UPI003728464C
MKTPSALALSDGDGTLKALTVWQPWASLIVYRVKPYEFRARRPPAGMVGRRIAIHAGARPVQLAELRDLVDRLSGSEAWTTGLMPAALDFLKRALEAPGLLPLSAVLGTAVLGAGVSAGELAPELRLTVNDSDRLNHCNFGWPLSEVERFDVPVPARGAQGFWAWRRPAAAPTVAASGIAETDHVRV